MSTDPIRRGFGTRPDAPAPSATTSSKLWELTRLTRALVTSTDYHRLHGEIVEAARRLLESDAAALVIEEADGLARVAAAVGVDPARRDAFAAPLDERVGPRLLDLFGHGPGDRILAVPLVDHDAIRGLLAIQRRAPAAALADEEAILSALADHAVIALLNTRRVLTLEQDVMRALRTERFLAEAGVVLSSSIDYGTTLASLARLAVGSLADRCVVDIVERDGSIRRLAVSEADPAKQALAGELYRFPPPVEGAHPVSRVLRTGRSEFAAEVSEAWLAAAARNPEHLDIMRRLGLTSYVCVPLNARGRTIGTLWLASERPDRRYGEADVAIAEELARRAALAVDNARLYSEAQEAIRARETFLARASHELRTPLTSALGTVRLLKQVMAGEVRHRPEELVEMAARSLDSMARLVNDLLDASKLAAGETLAAEPLDLAALVARALPIVAPQAGEKGISLHVALPPGIGVRGNAERLEQVVVNLLANAVKFTPPGGEVEVEAERGPSEVVLRVRDTGEGIPREDLEGIFQPFFGTARRSSRRPRGTGLGLSICRQILDLHGGRIWAESEGPGRGSTFFVALPAPGAGNVA